MKKLLVICAVAVTARAADFPSWLSGSWGGTVAGVRMEEHWTSPAGGLMLEMHRDVTAAGRATFEFARIEEHGGTLVYMAMPSGRAATPFPLRSQTAAKIIFENPTHNFPQRVIYWRNGEQLCARVEGVIKGSLNQRSGAGRGCERLSLLTAAQSPETSAVIFHSPATLLNPAR